MHATPKCSLLLLLLGAADAAEINDHAKGPKITESETVGYLFDELKLAAPKGASPAQKRTIVGYYLTELRGTLGQPPWDKDAVRRKYGKATDLEVHDDRPRREKIPLLTEPLIKIKRTAVNPDKTKTTVTYGPSVRDKLVQEERVAKEKIQLLDNPVTSFSAGPFRIRRSTASIREGLGSIITSGPDPDISKAKGAKLSFSDNRLEDGSGAWNSEGAVYIPIIRTSETLSYSTRLAFLPSVSWNLQEKQEIGKTDIDELKFALPIYFDRVGGAKARAFNAIIEPYYQTDTDFDGAIWGSTLALTYTGGIFGIDAPFASGDRRDFRFNDWNACCSGEYRLRFTGLVDYSETHETSIYSKRKKGDDWFRVGLDTGIDIGLFRKKKDEGQFGKTPLVFSVNYKFLDALGGEGGYSDLFSTNLTWWMSDYTGLTLEYQKGETPVADKEIDLITLGLEYRY
ncbi:hypothetical protein [Luteolibacter sp. Populi]|uniref:hypothetical protein n=1 Tax=Luteolibacter sp. Populi TaxID=3230487 RepID=UPI003467C553